MTSIATEARAKRLVCHFNRSSQGGELPIHFFQKGVSWLPAYEIELLSDTQARVRMRGSILNDAIDLNETQVSFIAGHPNLRFSTVSEVITANISAGDFYQQLTAALSPSQFGVPAQSMMTQNAIPWFVSNAPTIGGIPISDPLTQASSVELNGEFSEDLFYYSPVPVSLQKGGRGAWLISDDLCPYEHVYTWEVPETTFSRDGGDSSGSDTVPESEPVWHAIRLNNAGRQPWSTGTTFVLRDGRPLSQDAMRYTAPGQETRVRVTKALGISAQKEERETAREEGFRRSRSYIMERVTVEGELRVRNTLEETVILEISKEVLGEVQRTAPEANVSRRAEGIRHDNPHQTLVWTLELTPGEEETVSYTFQAYV